MYNGIKQIDISEDEVPGNQNSFFSTQAHQVAVALIFNQVRALAPWSYP